tara:strand:- start:3070 stop:3708 length:639 start_codon:yes stop_codon:yes gene_type:complete
MFTDEQKQELAEMIKSAATPAPVAPVAPVAAVEPEKPNLIPAPVKSIAEEAREKIEAARENAGALSLIESSIKFNISIDDFVERNKSILPEEAEAIISTAKTKTFKDDNEKANIIRKSLLDSFLSQKDNIKVLTGSLQNRAAKYNELTEGEKEKRSSEFWDLADVGVALKAAAKKAEILNGINGNSAGDATGGILEQKILAAAKIKFNQSNK